MAINDVRIIVSTTDQELFRVMQLGLSRTKGVELIINVSRDADAENKLSRQQPNVVIVDLDCGLHTFQFWKQLTDRFKVLIILTSLRNASATAFLRPPVKDFVLRPPQFTSYSMTNYVNGLSNRISSFGRVGETLRFKDMVKTVGVDSKLIAIASSTGGTTVLESILKSLPQDVPPILIVQHMPSGFTKLFADRLNGFCEMEIKEAASNDYLRRGLVLIAPADYHMALVRQGGKLAVDCYKGQKMHGVMPAADILFESVAGIMKGNAVGVVLTGMGADGAKGLMLMHNNGAKTIGQNKETCVVYGMPKVAKDLGAVDFELPIDKIPEKIMSLVE